MIDLREADYLERNGYLLPGQKTDQRRMVCEHGRHQTCETCIGYYVGTTVDSRNLFGERHIYDPGRRQWRTIPRRNP